MVPLVGLTESGGLTIIIDEAMSVRPFVGKFGVFRKTVCEEAVAENPRKPVNIQVSREYLTKHKLIFVNYNVKV